MRNSDRVIDLSVHSDLVFRICLGFSDNPLDAEELAQESYLRAIRKINSLNNTHLSREWLIKIAQNTCLNYVRKKRLLRWISSISENEYVEKNTPESLIVKTNNIKSLKGLSRIYPRYTKKFLFLENTMNFPTEKLVKPLGLRKEQSCQGFIVPVAP